MSSSLLVSVRDIQEAELAWQVGVGLVDVKEPTRGSLGPADVTIWQEIAEKAPPETSLSVALGELTEIAEASSQAVPDRFQFAKIGLAGCGQNPKWHIRWAQAWEGLPNTTQRDAVAYADWHQADSPDPADVILTGSSIGCSTVLVDTYQNEAGDVLYNLSTQQLRDLRKLALDLQMTFVLAGSLKQDSLPCLMPLAPDYFAVRGAVCRPNRQGSICQALLREFAAALLAEQKCVAGGHQRPVTKNTIA